MPSPSSTIRSAEVLPLAQAREQVADLLRPRPWIYWCDFLTSLAIGYTAAIYFFAAARASLGQAISFVIATLALYRLGAFIHEIVHFHHREMRSFRIAWNLLAGVPMLSPSFFYEPHAAHHNVRDFGTARDGEYLPLGLFRGRDWVPFVLFVVLQPLAIALRFVVLTPLSWLHPRLRRWTLCRLSSFVIRLDYRRRLPEGKLPRSWLVMDLLCWARATAIFVCPYLGLTPWTRIVQLYALAVGVLTLNQFRTWTAHRFEHADERRLSYADQVLDATTIVGGWLTELICPLGLRYHALHHWLPTLPYHNLGIAHRRLMQTLPEDSPYRRTVRSSFWAVLRERFVAM